MKYEEHIKEAVEDVISSIEEYCIRCNKNGLKYVICPFDSLEEYLRIYEYFIADIWYDLKNYDELSNEVIKTLEEEGKKQITEAYERVKAERILFLGEEEFFS